MKHKNYKDVIEVYTAYCEDRDTTFIVFDRFSEIGLEESKVIGMHSGEPWEHSFDAIESPDLRKLFERR